MTASVGRHCIASTKNTSAAAAVAGVNTSDPSLRVIARIRAITPSSTSASPPPPTSTDIVDTNTSRARKLVSTPTVSCQSKPSGRNTGSASRPSWPAKLPACSARHLEDVRLGVEPLRPERLHLGTGGSTFG